MKLKKMDGMIGFVASGYAAGFYSAGTGEFLKSSRQERLDKLAVV